MNHEPTDYLCPPCDWLGGNETEYKCNEYIVLQDAHITAFISPKWWINNPGHVIIIPNRHVENIYDIDDALLKHVTVATKRIAIAIRSAYDCTGTSACQHNELDGNQDVWHSPPMSSPATLATCSTRTTTTKPLPLPLIADSTQRGCVVILLITMYSSYTMDSVVYIPPYPTQPPTNYRGIFYLDIARK